MVPLTLFLAYLACYCSASSYYDSDIVYDWLELPSTLYPPSRRRSYASAYGVDVSDNLMGENLFIFGGRDVLGQELNDLWVFSFDQDRWKRIPSDGAPAPRLDAAMIVHEGILYVTGGFESEASIEPMNEVYMIDLTQNDGVDVMEWEVVEFTGDTENDFDNEFYQAGLAKDRELMCLQGGKTTCDLCCLNVTSRSIKCYLPDCATTNSTKPKPHYASAMSLDLESQTLYLIPGFPTDEDMLNYSFTVWAYHLIEEEWELLIEDSSLPIVGDVDLVSIGHKGYRFYGWDYETDAEFEEILEVDFNARTVNFMAIDADDAGFASFRKNCWPIFLPAEGNKIAIFGGWGAENYLNDLITFDVDIEDFSKIHGELDFPAARANCMMVTFGTDAYLFGGNDIETGEVFGDVWNLDMSSLNWFEVPIEGDLTSRYSYGMVILGVYVYVFGGNDGLGDVTTDFQRFSVIEYEVEQVEILSDDQPSARTGPTLGIFKEKIFLFGGESSGGDAYSDLWLFQGGMWEYQSEFTGSESGLRGATVNYDNGDVYIVAGKDDGMESGGIAWLNTSSNPMELVRLNEPQNMYGLGVQFISNGNYWSFGGIEWDGTDGDDSWYVWTMDTGVTIDLLDDPDIPQTRMASAFFAYDEFVYVFGGQMKGDVATAELLALNPPLCMYEGDTYCGGCSPGMYRMEDDCYPCRAGTYKDSSHDECMPCPKGFYGPYEGASSQLLCLFCPEGTYNPFEGADQCYECSDDTTCLAASWEQIDGTIDTASVVELPVFQPDFTNLVLTANNIIFYATFGGAFLILLVIGIMLCIHPKHQDLLIKSDLLFTESHSKDPVTGLPHERGTAVGGIMTILFIPVAVYLSMTLCTGLFYNNVHDGLSLMPLALEYQSGSGSMWDLDINFYGGVAQDCDCAYLTMAEFGLAYQSTHVQCRYLDTVEGPTCQIHWVCENCTLTESDFYVDFSFDDDNAYASMIKWELETYTGIHRPDGDGSDPDDLGQEALLGDVIFAQPEKVMRGREPQGILIKFFPVRYSYAEYGISDFGVFPVIEETLIGGQADTHNFLISTGLTFRLGGFYAESLLVVDRYHEYSLGGVTSAVLGAVAGLIGAFAGLLKFTEARLPALGIHPREEQMKFDIIDKLLKLNPDLVADLIRKDASNKGKIRTKTLDKLASLEAVELAELDYSWRKLERKIDDAETLRDRLTEKLDPEARTRMGMRALNPREIFHTKEELKTVEEELEVLLEYKDAISEPSSDSDSEEERKLKLKKRLTKQDRARLKKKAAQREENRQKVLARFEARDERLKEISGAVINFETDRSKSEEDETMKNTKKETGKETKKHSSKQSPKESSKQPKGDESKTPETSSKSDESFKQEESFSGTSKDSPKDDPSSNSDGAQDSRPRVLNNSTDATQHRDTAALFSLLRHISDTGEVPSFQRSSSKWSGEPAGEPVQGSSSKNWSSVRTSIRKDKNKRSGSRKGKSRSKSRGRKSSRSSSRKSRRNAVEVD